MIPVALQVDHLLYPLPLPLFPKHVGAPANTFIEPHAAQHLT
jgi:hypothetical protein